MRVHDWSVGMPRPPDWGPEWNRVKDMMCKFCGVKITIAEGTSWKHEILIRCILKDCDEAAVKKVLEE